MKYITEVLGVKSVVLPSALLVARAPQAPIESSLIIEGELSAPILFCSSNVVEAKEKEILLKMIKAMKLSYYAIASNVSLTNQVRLVESFRGQVIVGLGIAISAPQKEFIKTYPLAELLRNDQELQQRKKETWAQLKKAMEVLGVVQ